MCKHKHTTLVFDQLDDGTPVIIHQCDMCGLLHWRKEVDQTVDWDSLPLVDLVALEQAYTRIWRELLALPDVRP